MIRVAIIADSHFDEGSRFAECVRLHDEIAADLARRGVDLIAHAGDVFERRSTPTERRAVAEWLTRCAEIAPVLVVRGNHDQVGELSLFSRLRTKHPILVEEACGVHVIQNRSCPACGKLHHDGGEGATHAHRTYRCASDAAGPGCGHEWRRRAVAVAALAWPRKAELLARMRAGGAPALPREATDAVATEALRAVLRGLGEALAEHDAPRLLLAHAMVPGSITSTGQPLVGCDIEIGLDDLALAHADFVAVGHVHKGQDWTWGGVPVVYPGSPRRTAFGEIESKGYVIARFEHSGELAEDAPPGTRRSCLESWERVELSATPMVLLEGEWTGASLTYRQPGARSASPFESGLELAGALISGAEVRLRYTVEADQREAGKAATAAARAQLLGAGAIEVKIEEVVRPKARARAPEVARAKSLPDKLRALWAARGTTPPPDGEARLLARLAQLESEVAHAA